MADASVTFPGVGQVISADFTLSQGITPSVCTLTLAPQQNFPAAGGTLSLRFRSVKLDFPGCIIDSASYQANDGGQTWTLAILDRRWKWAFGKISGLYNRNQLDGKIDKLTEKKPRELATLCLEEMGESGYEVSALPDQARPAIAWDYDNPAQCLATLCDMLGCRVSLGLDNKVKIVKLGTGKDLPDNPLMADAGTVDPPERPDKLLLAGGIKLYQAQLKLEAVGLDMDGTIKKIDDLSYKPQVGWGKMPIDSDDWSGVNAQSALASQTPQTGPVSRNLKARKLAAETVFRWYRIVGARDGTLKIPGIKEPLKKINQIFPVSTELVQQIKDPFNENRLENMSARVVGQFFIFGLHGGNCNKFTTNGDTPSPNEDVEYTGGFSIDGERGIVKFAQPMVYEVAGVVWQPAEIYLETSFGKKGEKNNAYERYERELVASGSPSGTKERVYHDDGFLRTSYAVYDAMGKLLHVTNNDDDVNKQADEFLKEAGKEYQIRKPQDKTYAGLMKIEPDGAIQQVTWSINTSGATTRASRNSEYANFLPSHADRRRLEKAKNGPDQLDRLRKSNLLLNMPSGLEMRTA